MPATLAVLMMLLAHDGQRVLDAQEYAAQQHGHTEIEILHRDLFRRARHADDPGVVEQAVEPSPLLYGAFDQRLHVGLHGHVRVLVEGVRAELLHQRLAHLVLDVGREHPRALGDEAAHGRGADSAGASGDDRGLSVEPSHAVLLCLRGGDSLPRTPLNREFL